ncbi:MAG TPA: DEAD/DEAH box helicase [Candidatus Dormibacteraeota bacterium]|jgi:ATP-dependent Lhr-like helicase|nr:DEAD/DEAH box helicase [Candidatus Dormibacteraeota bacterium]
MSSLSLFTPAARAWFEASFEAPTEVQEKGWSAVAEGRHTLMCAPTGSGKTLAAFLWSIDRLAGETLPAGAERCRVLYVSPLKALTVDVERNLRAPLRGIALQAERAGTPIPELAVAVRTGDTPSAERARIERHPPDILITTPESLFLMLTSNARRVLRSVRWVIVDEIHSVAATKRGAHLALSLERLSALTETEPQRIGLSATQRPLEEVARFLGGTDRPVHIVDAGHRKVLDIRVEVPVEDMAQLERGVEMRSGSASAIGDDPGGPRRSIWPAIHPRLLELIREHRSTIVFVNSRRLAERLAAKLNELAGEELVRAHHGSIAREQRIAIEDALKQGRLPAIVATSSLELGIDMGAVDLVIQVESPTSVASGTQRIGRAGHSVGEPSRGVVFPKFRGDLLECATVVQRMLDGEIETTRVPRNPVDVLAQQIVAMTALEEWRVDDVRALSRRAYPFAELGDRAFEAVLEMLAGAYPADEFAELRPRIVWDRVAGTIRGRAGAQRLAVTSGGTIPDRGLYAVTLLEDGKRVGELDEEMVYETRPGDIIVLGATSWRVAEITQSQVQVSPAPGEPGRIAFWKGDALGRPVELGMAMGRTVRELAEADENSALQRLRERSAFDERAARNLLAYLRDQREATGALPDDRTVAVERFRDQLGDWRVCVLTCLGAKVHAPWSLAVAARLRERLDVDVQVIHSNDGFALRLPDVDRPPPVEELLVDPEDVDELVTAELAGSALFAARFRENAARALLLPRRRPGERTPLWKQRQRSHDLLQVAGRHASFPILVETYRECLSDVFDMEALRSLMGDLRSRRVRLAVADTERPSPFASSLLFDYVAQFMYEGDAPLAERRAQALTLDRDLLAELLGSAELRELLDPEAVALLELELQGLLPDRHPRDADEAHDLLRRLGDLGDDEAEARGITAAWRDALRADRRVVRVGVGGESRLIAAEDAALYRDAVGAMPPPGLPEAFLDSPGDPLLALLLRYARTHVPFVAEDPARRWGLPLRDVHAALRRLAASGAVLDGEFRPGRSGREWCHPEVLRSLRRRSLAALRREIEPVPAETLGRFLPAWQGVGGGGEGVERLVEVLAQLQGLPLPVSVLERDLLPARMAAYSPRLLDELISMGEVVWVGRGSLGSGDGRVALYLRSDAARLVPEPADAPEGELHARIREHLSQRGASFFHDLFREMGGDVETLVDALWDLVWSGEVTNDTYAPLRALGPRTRGGVHNPSRRPLRRLAPPRAAGRWSLVSGLRRPAPQPTEKLHALCGVLLQRHGVLTREAALAEGVPGGFAGLYPVLRAMEEAGRIRRGYFVDGLGGSQFALPGAVDRLRGEKDSPGTIVALSAVDPANPYGVGVPWPESAARLARAAGAFAVLDGGVLRLYLERGGRSLVTFGEVTAAHVQALAAAATRAGRLEIVSVDGGPVHGHAVAAALRDGGFGASPRGLVHWGERRALVGA